MGLKPIDVEAFKDRIVYNQTDFGEVGKYIRVEYVLNIIDEAVRRGAQA
jgi:hypothetical protein